MGRLLDAAIDAAEVLTPRELLELQDWLVRELEEQARKAAVVPKGRRAELVAAARASTRTLRAEFVTCGQSRCRCMKGGEPHGPYWYAYHRDGGRLRKEYVGLGDAESALERLQARKGR